MTPKVPGDRQGGDPLQNLTVGVSLASRHSGASQMGGSYETLFPLTQQQHLPDISKTDVTKELGFFFYCFVLRKICCPELLTQCLGSGPVG